MKRTAGIRAAAWMTAAGVFIASLSACGQGSSVGSTAAAGASAAETSAAETSTETSAAETSPESAVREGAAASAAEKGASGETVTITDHADRTVTVPADPEKAAFLDIYPLPSVLSVYLGSAESIAAMEPVSMKAAENGVLSELFPEILDAKTDFVNGSDVNIESLLALKPDIVYYTASNTAEQEMLENAGLNAVGISPTKWNFDCIRTYEEWTKLLDEIYPAHKAERDISSKVTDRSTQIYDSIQEKTKDLTDDKKQKVLFLYQYDENTMVTSGKKFFGQWWCDAVGAVNAASEVQAEKNNAVITMEQVYSWNPDVIVITNFTKTTPQDLYDNAVGGDDWSSVKAVQDKRVYKMPLGTYRTYTPGVDTPMTLEWLAEKVYPDLFEDIDLKKDVTDYYETLYGVTLTDEQVEKMYNPAPEAGM